MPDLDARGADAQPRAVRQIMIGSAEPFRPRKPEPLRLVRHRVIERPVSGMKPHRDAGFGYDFRHAEDMIEMGVREPNRDGLRACGLHLMQDQAGLFAGIDDRALAGLLVDDEIAVLGERSVGNLNDFHFCPLPSPCCSRSALRYFSTAIAAVVASPTAVVICRVTWLRTSPAANRPAIDVIMRLSVIRYPPASWSTWPSTSCVLGLNPAKMKTPPTSRFDRSPVALSSRTACVTPFVFPTISGTTVLRMTSIFGFVKARSWSSLEARNSSRRCTRCTLLA